MRRIIEKKIEDAMTKDVITVRKDTSLKELRDLFKQYDFNVFPVIENGEIMGVVTKLNFLKIFSFDPERLIPDLRSIYAKNAGDIMSKRIIAVCSGDSIQKAAQKMLDHRVRAVLVTDRSKKKLKGIITRGDIMKFVEVD
ncbi:MAG: CBS domain-containing protein [Candidatus Methanoperedens sp.]|nr:CBS domain-containing protein [Candidatus Methanoperedens sp.]MCZ7359013.1 CBS domain-containing protein [Candidatus Methanoperedens sp.]HLB71823.1 CBS domain-containing protein [Candidatus Methanoperedens sp.]